MLCKHPTYTYSVLAVGFDASEVQSWHSSTQHGEMKFSAGTLSDAGQLSPDVDAVIFDFLNGPTAPEIIRTLRSSAPSVGLVAIVNEAEEAAALAFGVHEVLVDLHGLEELATAVRRAVIRARARRQSTLTVEDEFISSVAHHLRTPLTAILGFGRELHATEGRFTEAETMGMLGDMVAAAQAATNIVEDMAVAARIELATLQFASQTVQLADQVGRVLEEISLEIPVDGNVGEAQADPARVRQVLRAMVSNAIAHGGPPIKISLHELESSVRVEVADNGSGISAASSIGLFDRYETTLRSSTTPAPLGIGLHVARRLAREMGGDLDYVRHDEQTIFRLSLPLATDCE